MTTELVRLSVKLNLNTRGKKDETGCGLKSTEGMKGNSRKARSTLEMRCWHVRRQQERARRELEEEHILKRS